MIDIINKQVEEFDKVGLCDCGCHTSPHSDADMKINGCDLCYERSEYAPRHPDKRNILVSSMLKVGEEIKRLAYENKRVQSCIHAEKSFRRIETPYITLDDLDNIISLTEGE